MSVLRALPLQETTESRRGWLPLISSRSIISTIDKVRGWPAVRGEIVEGDTAGYHYYPGRARVMAWLADEGLELVDEAFDQQDGWGYRHLLLRS